MKPMATAATTTQANPTSRARAKLGSIIETIPAAGKKMMYTSGWPKIQNRCRQSSGSPPLAGSKKGMPRARSSSSSRSAAITAGMPIMIMPPVTSMYQAKIGMSARVMPGARVFSTPAMISTAAATAEISTEQAREDEHAADGVAPVAEGGEPGKGHVPRADHARQQHDGEGLADRHTEQEHQHRAVHGEELIIGAVIEEGVVRQRE